MIHNDALAALTLSYRLRELARQWDESRLQVLRDALQGLNAALLLPSETTIRSFTGDLLACDLRDEIAQEIFTFGATDYELSEFELTALRPRHVVCDVGAHIGYHTQLMARAVGNEGRVFAFEPTPRTFGYLQRNVGWLQQVTINCCAIGDCERDVELLDYGPRLAAFNSLHGIRVDETDRRADAQPHVLTVKQRNLDEVFRALETKLDYVKIDVESAEIAVLRGMGQLLKISRPTIALEVGDFSHLINKGVSSTVHLIDYLGGFGYRPFDFLAGKLKPHRVKVIGEYGYMNLIFIHLESDSPGSDLAHWS